MSITPTKSVPNQVTLTNEVLLKVKKLHPDAKLPLTWNDHSLSLQIFAHLLTEDGKRNRSILPPRTAKRIPTGLSIECAPGYCLLPLSNLRRSMKGIFVMNHLLLADPDYRGELFITLYNGGHETDYIEHEERLATVVAYPIRNLRIIEEVSK